MPWFSRATGTGFSFSTRQMCRPGERTKPGNGEPLWAGGGLTVARARENGPKQRSRGPGQAWEERS